MNQKIISVCCTCHNRKEKTIACINSLYKQDAVLNKRVLLKVFLCDDDSNDGTVDAIKTEFPNVNIVKGSGELFWARGMEKAFAEAKKHNTDFYLMVNDDVIFEDYMIDSLFTSYEAAKSKYNEIAVVGSIKDEEGNWSYGGKGWEKKLFKDIKPIIMPQAPYVECKLANWNCFLLSTSLAEKVGNIETVYEHALADYDYSIRILNVDGLIITTGNFVGICSRNETSGTWQDRSLPLRKRYKLLHHKTARPIRSYIHYCKVAYGKGWLYRFILQYIWIAKTSLMFKVRS